MSRSSSTEIQSDGGPLPEPRGKTGISSATKGELVADIAWYETWATRSGWAVAMGVFVEVPLIWWAFEKPWIGHIFETLATLTIGLGVAGEVLFSKKAALRQGELLSRSEKHLAIVLERTEYRSLKDGKLLEALKKYPPAALILRYVGDDPESSSYARDFELVFSASGWRVSWYTESYGDELVPGLISPSRNAEDAEAINSLREALTEAGIGFSDTWAPSAFQSTGPFGAPPEKPGLAMLYIGPKPLVARWG